MITYLGSYSVGGLMPAISGMLAAIIPRLQAQLAGALRVNGSLAINLPSLDARIAAVGRVAASLALQPPGVRFNIAANADYVALLQAQLSIILALQTALGQVGIEAFVYDGPGSSAGPEIASALGGGLPGGTAGEHIDALVLATRFPEAFAALGQALVT